MERAGLEPATPSLQIQCSAGLRSSPVPRVSEQAIVSLVRCRREPGLVSVI
jgi:hypothetical protein